MKLSSLKTSPKKLALCMALAATLITSLQAAVTRELTVSYQTQNGWSKKTATKVKFIAGAEWNPRNSNLRLNRQNVYALIWFNPDQMVVVKIKNTYDAVKPDYKAFGPVFTAQQYVSMMTLEGRQGSIKGVQVSGSSQRSWRFYASEPKRGGAGLDLRNMGDLADSAVASHKEYMAMEAQQLQLELARRNNQRNKAHHEQQMFINHNYKVIAKDVRNMNPRADDFEARLKHLPVGIQSSPLFRERIAYLIRMRRLYLKNR